MSKSKRTQFAPARDGRQIAGAWRVWAQGDEFYANPLMFDNLGKLSFHHGNRWLHRIGHTVRTLAKPLKLSGGWLHACQLSFLTRPGLYLPNEKRTSPINLIELPLAHKLVVNLLLCPDASRPNFVPPREIGGDRLGAWRLRSGASFLVTHRVLPMTDNDANILSDIQEKLRITLTKDPTPGDFYAEASWHSFSAESGNAIAIVPAGPDAVAKSVASGESAT